VAREAPARVHGPLEVSDLGAEVIKVERPGALDLYWYVALRSRWKRGEFVRFCMCGFGLTHSG